MTYAERHPHPGPRDLAWAAESEAYDDWTHDRAEHAVAVGLDDMVERVRARWNDAAVLADQPLALATIAELCLLLGDPLPEDLFP